MNRYIRAAGQDNEEIILDRRIPGIVLAPAAQPDDEDIIFEGIVQGQPPDVVELGIMNVAAVPGVAVAEGGRRRRRRAEVLAAREGVRAEREEERRERRAEIYARINERTRREQEDLRGRLGFVQPDNERQGGARIVPQRRVPAANPVPELPVNNSGLGRAPIVQRPPAPAPPQRRMQNQQRGRDVVALPPAARAPLQRPPAPAPPQRRMQNQQRGRDVVALPPAARAPLQRLPAPAPPQRRMQNQQRGRDVVALPPAARAPLAPAVPIPEAPIRDLDRAYIALLPRAPVGQQPAPAPAPARGIFLDDLEPHILNRPPRIEFVDLEKWFWRTLHDANHEVLVTNVRGTIQPQLHFHVFDLDEAQRYEFVLCVELVNDWVYRFEKGRGWSGYFVVNRDEFPPTKEESEVPHEDGVKTGGEWMAAPLRFDNARITMNREDRGRNVIRLLGNRKYRIRIDVRTMGPDNVCTHQRAVQIPTTEFIACPHHFKV
ncbi:hypothetical protein CAEBREN_22492 [Caenorhabditis brenneri]|uniref:T-box domain-containing protein n=1 Tax=Caenorhabditis brenneri TaxID=135651 RepID=G0MB07_CAEBE|nr:hypothetical protein CAEBREN_22492 [Caenorhabditis brenneri]